MKKSLLRFALGGLALVAAGTMTGQVTLTQDWAYTEDLPKAADARWGTGLDGKLWTNDKSVPQLIYWDSEGKHLVTDAASAPLGMKGTGITIDAAGNILASDAFAGAGASTTFKILPAGSNELKSLSVTLPEGSTAGRMDFIGRISGNIMSAEGGAVYLCPQNSTSVAKIFIANGEQVVEKSKSFPAIVACGTDGFAQPTDNNPEGDNFVARPARTQQTFSYYVDGTPTAYTAVGSNTSAGGDIVTLNGVTYTIEPNQTAYCDGFQVVDRSTNEVVATHTEQFNQKAATPNQNSLTVQKIDEYTAYIYQFVPAQLVAKYTLSLPKPLPQLEARNAYAYDIVVDKTDDSYVVSYRLNAPAESASVELWADGAVAKSYEGTVNAKYGDYEKTTIDNLNTVTIPAADIPKNAKVSFRVSVVSPTVENPVEFSEIYKFWSPYGIAVNNDPDSPSFGRVFVTEGQTNLPATGYLASVDEQGIGNGIYAFDQTMKPIKNSEGKYGFTAGMTVNIDKYAGTNTSFYEFKRLQFSEDGRLFLSRAGTKSTSLWEIDPMNPEANATEIFKGTLGEDGYVTDANGNFVAGPATAMSVYGKGADLKVAIVACKDGYILAPGSHRVDIYNLGKQKEWSTAPSQAVESISGKYWVNSATVNAAFDNDGKGLMVGQYRGAPNDAEPAYVHVNLTTGAEDYKDVTTPAGGAAMAWNADKTLFAMATGKGMVGIFEVTKDENGVPTFTKKYEFNTGCGTNTNAIAFDYANNIYVASNSGEKFKSFSLPRQDGKVTVAAASKYDVTISSDEYPAELYIIGSTTNWDSTKGVKMQKGENGVYTGEITTTAATDNVVLVAELGDDWAVVNQNRWGFATDNSMVTINKPQPIVKVADGGAMQIGAIGTYKVTVDMANMTILFEGEEPPVVHPDQLYVIGNITTDTSKHWKTNDGTYKLEKEADANVYKLSEVVLYSADGTCYFALISELGDGEQDWSVNEVRYGPAVGNTLIESGVAAEIGKNGDTSYQIAAGTYDMVVDLDASTITMTKKEGGAEEITNAVAVVAGRGEIRIVGNAQSISIYGINGQTVAYNSTETSFNVPAGVYVVVVDGVKTKVMVR